MLDLSQHPTDYIKCKWVEYASETTKIFGLDFKNTTMICCFRGAHLNLGRQVSWKQVEKDVTRKHNT